MFVRCVAMIVLLSGERVGASAGSREAGRLPEAQERFPLPCFYCTGLTCQKQGIFIRKF